MPLSIDPETEKTLNAITYALFAGGLALILITPFIINKNAIYATIAGYISILISLFVVYGYISVKKFNNSGDKLSIMMVCGSLTIIVLLSMHLLSKYVDVISQGIVPNYSILTGLSGLLLAVQIYGIKSMIFTGVGMAPVLSESVVALLLACKLFNYLLIIVLTIILKYFVTDG